MGQEQNNSQPQATTPNQNKRHYREIGGPVQADAATQGNQRAVARSGGNRPPRNNQRPSAGGQPQSAGSSGPRPQRRPKNRRPSSQQTMKQGPVERFDSGRQNDRNSSNINKSGPVPEQIDTAIQAYEVESMKAEPIKVKDAVRKQPRQDRNPRQDQQQRNEQTRPAVQNNRQPARWEKKVRTEETYEDVKRDNERIEKEIWLEIASIHTIKLDF